MADEAPEWLQTMPAPYVPCEACCSCAEGCFLSGYGFETRFLEFIGTSDTASVPNYQYALLDSMMPPAPGGKWVNIGSSMSPNWADFSSQAGLYFLSVFSELASGGIISDVGAYYDTITAGSHPVVTRHMGIIRARWGTPEVVWGHPYGECRTAVLLRSQSNATAFFWDRQAINSVPTSRVMVSLEHRGNKVSSIQGTAVLGTSTPCADGEWFYQGTKRWKLSNLATSYNSPAVVNPLHTDGDVVYYATGGGSKGGLHNIWKYDGVSSVQFVDVDGPSFGGGNVMGMIPFKEGFLVFGNFTAINGVACDHVGYVLPDGTASSLGWGMEETVIRAHYNPDTDALSLITWDRVWPFNPEGTWRFYIHRRACADGTELHDPFEGGHLGILDFCLGQTTNLPMASTPPLFLPDGTAFVVDYFEPNSEIVRLLKVGTDNVQESDTTWEGDSIAWTIGHIRSIVRHESPSARSLVLGGFHTFEGELSNGCRAIDDNGADAECGAEA